MCGHAFAEEGYDSGGGGFMNGLGGGPTGETVDGYNWIFWTEYKSVWAADIYF